MRGRGIRAITAVLCLSAVGASSAAAAAPTISDAGFAEVTTSSATFKAEINPQGKKTSYHFEYGLEDCSTSTCTPVPIIDQKIPAGTSPVAVPPVPVEGLVPGTTYHLRVVASNNEGTTPGPDVLFRTYVPPFAGLPDGRAYEQASPVEKNAADARGVVAWAKAADDGSSVGFLNTSGIPNGVGEQEVPNYLASRGSSDWSTQGLLPPATLGTEAFVRGWLPDFTSVFDFAGDFSSSGSDGVLVSRSSADGSLAQIVGKGEGLAGSVGFPTYAAASADGSKVLFEIGAKLPCCEKALAGAQNLYLWDRDSGQISLISVLNDEQSPPSGSSAGPYDWMETPTLPLNAQPGGSVGGYYTQDMHALSADGESVFFTTVGSGTLYERINLGAKQSLLDGDGQCTEPDKACTLEVSASHRVPPDPLGSRPAALMAATPGGDSAFFVSPEELTDDANTGPVALSPTIGHADISSEPPAVKPDFPITALGVATDAKYIYWINPREDAIGRAELIGEEEDPTFIEVPPLKVCPAEKACPPAEEVEVQANPQYVAVDGEHIYWTNEGEGERKEGTIGRALKSDGSGVEAEWIKGATRPKGIAVDSEHVYWANAGRGATEEGTIGRADINGKAESVKQEFVVSQGTQFPVGVAVDASHIYWTLIAPSGNLGFVAMAELADGSNEKFIDTKSQPRGIAIDGEHVYWASQAEEAIGQASLELGDIQSKFIPTKGKPIGLTKEGANLYWSVNGEVTPNPGNDLYRYRPEGEELEDVTPDSAKANGAEVKGVLGASEDGKRVYFAANGVLAGGGKAGDCSGKLSSVFIFDGQCNLYLAEEASAGAWSTSFIAPLDASGGGEQSDATDWLGKSGGASRSQRTALVSANGDTLLFRSQEQLTSYDNEGNPELYRYEASGVLSCISCNPTGEAPGGAASLGSIGLSALEPQLSPASVLSRNLSADGKRAFFESLDPLAINDINGEAGCKSEGTGTFTFPVCRDVYEWEAQGTGSCQEDVQGGGCLYLLSTGSNPHASFFADASLSGNDAFIATRSAGLVRQDQDQLQDIFDARIGGGLASQNQVSPPPCEGLDGCHGPQSAPPGFESPPSASLGGPGNKKQVRHPAKKKHKKKHRKHKKNQHKQRAAHKTGGKSR